MTIRKYIKFKAFTKFSLKKYNENIDIKCKMLYNAKKIKKNGVHIYGYDCSMGYK